MVLLLKLLNILNKTLNPEQNIGRIVQDMGSFNWKGFGPTESHAAQRRFHLLQRVHSIEIHILQVYTVLKVPKKKHCIPTQLLNLNTIDCGPK